MPATAVAARAAVGEVPATAVAVRAMEGDMAATAVPAVEGALEEGEVGR